MEQFRRKQGRQPSLLLGQCLLTACQQNHLGAMDLSMEENDSCEGEGEKESSLEWAIDAVCRMDSSCSDEDARNRGFVSRL